MKVNIALFITDTRTLKTDKSGNILVKKIRNKHIWLKEILKTAKKILKKY